MDKKYTYVDIYHLFWTVNPNMEITKDEFEMLTRSLYLYMYEDYSSRAACAKAVEEFYERRGK